MWSKPLQIFNNDDTGYLRWVKANPRAYVVNTTKPALPNFLILHLASCPAVYGEAGVGNYWTAGSLKACSARRNELEDWAQNQIGGQVQACRLCKP